MTRRFDFKQNAAADTRLFEELALAHADGSYTRLLARFAKAGVLILDDRGLATLGDQ